MVPYIASFENQAWADIEMTLSSEVVNYILLNILLYNTKDVMLKYNFFLLKKTIILFSITQVSLYSLNIKRKMSKLLPILL